MSLTVGIDIGTHQSKICIEDRSNPLTPIYEFFEFLDLNGEISFVLPSIVQINEDNTVSYGHVNRKNCKELDEKDFIRPFPIEPEYKKPVLYQVPHKPRFIHPKKPRLNHKVEEYHKKVKDLKKLKHGASKKKRNDIDNTISFFKHQIELEQNLFENNKIKYKNRLNQIDNKIKEWKEKCSSIKKRNELLIQQNDLDYKIAKKTYSLEIEKWKKDKDNGQRYRYFKQATFTNTFQWDYSIPPRYITTLYLGYLMFLVRDKIGSLDFRTHIGIPNELNTLDSIELEKRAIKIFILADKILDKYKSLENYLNENYINLFKFIDDVEKTITKEDIDDSENLYGLIILPEAYAALRSITERGLIPHGMNLLVDIGGGTTDIAFFLINHDNSPDIHKIISVHKGLNFIFESYRNKRKTYISWEDIHEKFINGRPSIFKDSIDEYYSDINVNIASLKSQLKDVFRNVFPNLPISLLNDALNNRPLIFSGGGSVFKSMKRELDVFTDIETINKQLLSIHNYVLNRGIPDNLYPILSTSFGLSMEIEDKEKIILTPFEKIFNHVNIEVEEQNDNNEEYGLRDW